MLELIVSNSNLKKAMQDYNEQIKDGLIKPKLIKILPYKLNDSEYLLLIREQKQITGIMNYFYFKTAREYNTILHEKIPLNLKNINYLIEIESFKHGNGTKMLDWLKDRSDMIVLFPLDNAISWYLKQGFNYFSGKQLHTANNLYWQR